MHRRAYGRSTIYFGLFDRWEGPYDHVLQSFAGGGIYSYATARVQSGGQAKNVSINS